MQARRLRPPIALRQVAGVARMATPVCRGSLREPQPPLRMALLQSHCFAYRQTLPAPSQRRRRFLTALSIPRHGRRSFAIRFNWHRLPCRPAVRRRPSPHPETCAKPQRVMPLDEAIRIALENDRVIRVLAGVTAVNSGRTIYDVAIANTVIDQQQARFDPLITVNNNWDHLELPTAFPDPGDPTQTIIGGLTTNQYRLNAALTKDNPVWRAVPRRRRAPRKRFSSRASSRSIRKRTPRPTLATRSRCCRALAGGRIWRRSCWRGSTPSGRSFSSRTPCRSRSAA